MLYKILIPILAIAAMLFAMGLSSGDGDNPPQQAPQASNQSAPAPQSTPPVGDSAFKQ